MTTVLADQPLRGAIRTAGMARALKRHDRVRVVTDRFRKDDAPAGTIGTVLDVFHDGSVEVEVRRHDGTTIALFTAGAGELERVTEEAQSN